MKTILMKIKGIIQQTGEVDVRDVNRATRQAIYASIEAAADRIDYDGDSDDMYTIFHFGGRDSDDSITVFAPSNEYEETASTFRHVQVTYTAADVYDMSADTLEEIDGIIAEIDDAAARGFTVNNLTPHDVVVYDEAGAEVIATIPASGVFARVNQSAEVLPDINGIPAVRTVYGEVTDLPDPQPDAINIVSIVVAQALADSGREDIYVPDTGPASVVRDGGGRILGVRRLMRL